MNRSVRIVVLSAGFMFTGLGCALPGVLLPALLHLWHWNDGQAGRLFLILALSSAAGPLCLFPQLRRSILLAFGLVAAASFAWSFPGVSPMWIGVLWGLGLGIGMTSISLMTSQFASLPGVALVRINFLWALGACLCPLLVTPLLARFGVRAMLCGCSGVALLLASAAFLLPARAAVQRDGTRLEGKGRIQRSLVAAAVLATGVEASGGAWLATYADRFDKGAHATLALPSLFWGGLLLSRALSSRPAASSARAAYLRSLCGLTTLASVLLLFPAGRLLPAVAAFALGFGLGPIYPELLARVLAVRQTRSVFLLAGVTSAVLPWATGVLSHRTHSLVLGMLIPCAGSLALLVNGWLGTRESAAA